MAERQHYPNPDSAISSAEKNKYETSGWLYRSLNPCGFLCNVR
jgi:hypothetical protein